MFVTFGSSLIIERRCSMLDLSADLQYYLFHKASGSLPAQNTTVVLGLGVLKSIHHSSFLRIRTGNIIHVSSLMFTVHLASPGA